MTPLGFEAAPRLQGDGAASRSGSAGWAGQLAWRCAGSRHWRPWLKRLDALAERTGPMLLLLFLGSVFINLLVGFFLCYRAGLHALDWDEAEYWGLSSQILAGHWDPAERRTIAFPLVLAGLRGITSNFSAIQAELSIVSGLTAPLLNGVIRRLGGSPRMALIGGMAMALWPAQLFLATSLYSETVALPCFLLFLLILPTGSRMIRSEWQWPASLRAAAVVSGMMLGLCAQIRPMYLLFLPFALIVPFLEERSPRRAGKTAFLVALGFALLVAPWSAWMSHRHGHLIILTANGGETLAGGLNPNLVAMPEIEKHLALRDTWVGPGKWLPPELTGYLTPAETRLPYPEMSHLLQQRSLAWIAAHPGDALRVEWCKLIYMWGLYPWRGDDPLRLLAGNIPILALLGIALAAARRGLVPGLALARLWVVPLFVTGVALISWGSWRFRQPADAALIALCIILVGFRSNPPRLTAPRA